MSARINKITNIHFMKIYKDIYIFHSLIGYADQAEIHVSDQETEEKGTQKQILGHNLWVTG